MISDPSTVDLARTRLKIRPGVQFVPQVYGDTHYYHIEDSASGRYFRIGYTEYVFVSLLDGNTTFCEALALTAQTQSAMALPQQQAMTIYRWLLNNNLAHFNRRSNGISHQDHSEEKPRQPLIARFNPFWIRIPLGNPNAALKALQPYLGWLFSGPATIAALILMAAAGFRLLADWDRFSAASVAVFAPDNWLWLLLAWLGLKFVHETAHGLVCLRYGGSVRESGVILAFLAPLAFVDVTSGWGFGSRWQRIHVSLAGMYMELLLASLAIFGWSFMDSAVAAHLMYNVIVMASVSTLLFNANPLMRFDGYYILSDLVQIPNLWSQSTQVLKQACSHALFGVRSTLPVSLGRAAWLLRTYGIAAMLWRVTICVSLLIAGSVLFHGAGVLLSLPGTIAWFGVPAWHGLKTWRRIWLSSPVRAIRGIAIVGTAAGVIATALFGLPFPVGAAAPGIVELPEGSAVRAGADGFIRTVHVTDGEVVEPGALLLELENQRIRADYADVVLQVQQETIRLQAALKEHQAGLANVARGNLASLKVRLDEAARQVAMLEVRATTGGRVAARDLAVRRDSYVREGDELLTIDAGQPRELRVSINQDDFPIAQSKVGRSLAVRIGTRDRIEGVLKRLNPRASRRLPAEALAATAGGSLPVVQSQPADHDASPQRLTNERFDAIVQLPAESALSLRRGERGYVSLGLRDESLAARLHRVTANWFREQLRMAESMQ